VRVWKPVALVYAVLVLTAGAGCGSGGGSSAGAGGGGGASSDGVPAAGAAALPATTAAFLAVSTAFDSEQWKQIEALGAKFPGYARLLEQGRAQLAQQGLDFDQDVRPALGPEVDVGWLDLKSADDYVAVTKPDDTAKLDALIAKAKPPLARADVNGYAVVAESKTLVDSVSGATDHLSDDPSFKAAMAALPGGDVVRLYLNGPQVQSALESSLAKGSSGSSGSPTFSLPAGASVGTFDWLAASAEAQADGVRIDGAVKAEPAPTIQPYTAELPNELASGAVLFADFANLDQTAKNALDALGKSAPSVNQELGQLEGVSGLSLDNDVIPLLKNEGAIAVYASTGKTPTIVYALKVDDEAKVEKLLDQLGAIAALAGGGGGGGPTAASVPGYPNAKQLKLGTTTIVYGVADGRLVISNTAAGLGDVGGSGPKLADDARFKAAQDDVKMPGQTTGFLYADLKTGLPLVAGVAGSSGTKIPPSVTENTSALQSALFYSTVDGDLLRFTGFVGVG
jgi:hypothetical protein